MASGECAAVARGLYAKGEEGPIFGPLDFDIPRKGLTVVSGPSGSGRTSLALVLSGRMAPNSGNLEVVGRTARKDVRRHVALAGVDQVDELERSVRVRDVVTESKAWASPWFSLVGKARTADLEKLCAPVFGERPLPELDIYVSELLPLDDLLLRICFALHPAHGTPPELLVVDDLEQLVDVEDQREMVEILARLAENMPVVLTTVNTLGTDAPAHFAFALDRDEEKIGDESGVADTAAEDADAAAKEDAQ